MNGKPHMVQLIDLIKFKSDPDGDLFYDGQKTNRDSQKYVRLPMDFPGYLRVMRVTKQPVVDGTGKATIWEPVAVTLELDMFTFGVKLYVRVGKDGTCKIISEDGDGREKLAEYTRETMGKESV